MNSVVLIGGAGLIGSSLISELSRSNIYVAIVLNKRGLPKHLTGFDCNEVGYFDIPESDDWVLDLAATMAENSRIDDCVLINLAWRGHSKLVDGSLAQQLKNIKLSTDCVRLASLIGAKKYIASGSMEEVTLERIIDSDLWQKDCAFSVPSWYAFAKRSARMQSAFEAYRKRIDFCYLQISIVIDKKLRTEKFVEQSFKSILANGVMPRPNNHELCNICSSEEIARQISAVAVAGKNKATYRLGTGECDSLQGYFSSFANLVLPPGLPKNKREPGPFGVLTPADFALNLLLNDTGYKARENKDSLFNQILTRQ
jgi:nucleoside-diphosphate-sugar epimerase